jgi:hypothetical protein
MAIQAHEARYKFYEYKELGYNDVFSGMAPTSKWLLKTHIFELLTKNGFSSVKVLSDKIERNGPRISLIASK